MPDYETPKLPDAWGSITLKTGDVIFVSALVFQAICDPAIKVADVTVCGPWLSFTDLFGIWRKVRAFDIMMLAELTPDKLRHADEMRDSLNDIT